VEGKFYEVGIFGPPYCPCDSNSTCWTTNYSWWKDLVLASISCNKTSTTSPVSLLPLAGLKDTYLLRSCATLYFVNELQIYLQHSICILLSKSLLTLKITCFQKSNSSTFKAVQTKIQRLSRSMSVFKDFQGLARALNGIRGSGMTCR